MAYDRTILDKKMPFSVTIGTTAVKPGDALGHDGSTWVLADADTPSLYCRAFATQYIPASGTGEAAVEVWLEDLDAPYTLGSEVYLSGTAGAHTHTRPNTVGDLVQHLGQAISTSVVHLAGGKLRSKEYFFQPNGASTAFQIDSLPGVAFAAVDGSDYAWFAGMFPTNMVSLDEAYIIMDNNGATSALDIDVTGVAADAASSAADASNVQDTGAAITAGATINTPADNKVLRMDVSSLMDADFAVPGRVFAIKADPDGLGGGTSQTAVLLYCRFNCVEPF